MAALVEGDHMQAFAREAKALGVGAGVEAGGMQEDRVDGPVRIAEAVAGDATLGQFKTDRTRRCTHRAFPIGWARAGLVQLEQEAVMKLATVGYQNDTQAAFIERLKAADVAI